jgi:hypothetical protein
MTSTGMKKSSCYRLDLSKLQKKGCGKKGRKQIWSVTPYKYDASIDYSSGDEGIMVDFQQYEIKSPHCEITPGIQDGTPD